MRGPADVNTVFLGALGISIILGLFFSGVSPKEITWDEEICTIRGRFTQSGSYGWNQLEAWNPYESKGMFLIKFENDMTYQIPSIVFTATEWKKFRGFLEQNYGQKKRTIWMNFKPLR